jgi:transcriptional regulator
MPTIRQQMIDLLLQETHDVREISQALGISEKEVNTHLPHIDKSVASQNRKLQVSPATCTECGFTFKDRRRLTKPSRCPRCRGQRIQSPRYRVV